ncbi:hypothetical protein ACFLRM_06770 [Acidobacteriota bacterium]
MAERGSVHRKKSKIPGQFVPLLYQMLKGPLINESYLKPMDVFFYSMILAQTTGDPKIDKELYYTHSLASKHASSSTYSMSKLRLWAFRCLEVVKWGRQDQTPTKFKESHRWLALIRIPTKMQRIHTLVKRYERVFNFHPKNRPKRTKEERSKKKQLLYQCLKREIVKVF